MGVPIQRPDTPPADLAAAFAAAGERLGEFARPLYFSTIGSTNDVAAALAATGRTEGTVVIADEQTAGRGRRGRTWFSPPGTGLYVSVVINPSRCVAETGRATSLLTLTAGVAIAEGIELAAGLAPDIKWPNDLLIQRRKIGGILAEGVATSSSTLSCVVLGYGINVGPMNYPPDLAGRASSLENELGRKVDRVAVCIETLAALARRRDDLLAGRFDAILDDWSVRAPGSRGSRVTWQTPDGPRLGITQGVDGNGALLVRVNDRIEHIVAGEVTWL